MVDYRVRSVSLLNLVNDIRNELLIPDAYFQRNLVWREIHNKDFIKTILLGFPFPQIFISKGKVDVINMTTVSCIVDGQQRSNAIIKFIENEFDVDGRYFDNLSPDEKSAFLKYEIAVIELDIENDDPKVQQIFQRINRTSNALTVIEKLASEYSVSEYMLVAKLLSDQIDLNGNEQDYEDFREDPNIPKSFYTWARAQKVSKFVSLIVDKNIYNPRDIARKVHLMHVLNMMTSVLAGFFNRNELSMRFLEDYTVDFVEKELVVSKLERSADIILKLKLKVKSYWHNKANIFSLIVALANNLDDIDMSKLEDFKNALAEFEADIPADFRLAATEAVNNKKERELRDDKIVAMIQESFV
ncbi:hypothetical protein J2Y45_000407 [Dyadobacter sp. BE34]|uniref:GmrSD restriction endonucleases N-terminal domain-containing protein n=1 Tax=Dyadobacter fermentans TaxID=94254 RepID=A0ABU1QPV4_9BACT|nr:MULTISPECIES: DUF262 domain-containing protein [Dyadobacter]MDR6803137.1 hypothetical protein [Dyadobacter fermentans]MDR7040879.1 hypothetical protein [Dyadobacter sp. BE242]MDR7195281.1 hypothetical protein [Dyadobacter sp. BE34]MDR7214173.1 hypothetical protein [Dyadobacter sp. BE31]MDR7260689.1 hypothetical protein [Dyadobacter sp. BE32]